MWGLNWIEIFLWYSCNLKCNFCFQKDLRLKDSKFVSYDYVIDVINKWSLEWKTSVIFSGWESTLDPNLIKYIEYCKKKWFFDIRVHTNWLKFSDKEKLNSYISSWMTGVIISIHWYWKIHDYLVWCDGSFDKITKTLLNLTEVKKHNSKFVIDTNTVLNKFNYNNLYVLFKFLSHFPITRSQIVQLYSLYLFSLKEKQNLYISYDNFSKELWKIINTNKNITLENFPFCKIDKKYWDLISKRQKYNNEAFWNMWEWFEESDCTYLNECSWCYYKKQCTWIPKDYLSVFSKEKFII